MGTRPQGRILLLVLAAGLLATATAACGDSNDSSSTSGSTGGASASLSGEIAGAGSTAQQAAQEAWIAGFQEANSGVSIAYDPVGSGGGREQFTAGGVAYAGSDAALDPDELKAAEGTCGGTNNVVEVPNYVSPIAIIYNVSGVDSLQLSPDTLAKIFAQKITKWNDPAIATDNPGADLPDTNITPVNRSDESGTTENFTDYLAATAPEVWTFEPDGVWPLESGEGAQGTSGVVDAVTNGTGTIGYADASRAGDLGTVSIKVGDEYVSYSPEAAAAVVDASPLAEGRSEGDLAIEVDHATEEAGVYPIILVSYLIGCQQYADSENVELVKSYFSYVASPEGQDAAAEAAGSAPISDSLRDQINAAIDSIQ